MELNTLTYHKKDQVGLVQFTRREKMNVINQPFLDDLAEVLDATEKDQEVRVIVLTGGETVFCAGADLSTFNLSNLNVDDLTGMIRNVNIVFDRIEAFPKPVIAAIGGFALGGGLELALTCDIRVASETAQLGLPECKLGIVPLGGGTQRLPRVVGVGRAKEMMFTGDPLDARAALEIGLVSKLYPASELIADATKLAGRITRRAPLALQAIKSVVHSGLDTNLQHGLEIESEAGRRMALTHDFKEGIQAFFESRSPVFRER